jgi:hypothetical protein
MIWFTASDTAAQKPTLDLLPSSHEHVHPEAMIDTSSTMDSPVLFAPNTPTASLPVIHSDGDGMEKNERQKGTGLDSLFKKRYTKKVQEGMNPGINSLIILNINPIQFLIYMTALNF